MSVANQPASLPAKSGVCTLFEGHYQLGFAALTNSLVAAGFTGKIFAGYRGPLPPWSEGRSVSEPNGTHTMVCGTAVIVFVPVDTLRHLTNYKPEFMLDVWERLAEDCERLFYFDSDIIVLARWSFFDAWADAGVAVVMDGSTPLSKNHPLRAAWRRHFEPHGFRFASQHDYHFNGGFIGVKRADRGALVEWKKIQSTMESTVPLNLPVGLHGAPEHMRDRLFPFFLTDQDALNIMADLEGIQLSAMGPEGMGWKIPEIFMMHALGSPKPWLGRYLQQALRGHAPKMIDQRFWTFMEEPIAIFSAAHVRKMKRHIKWAHVIAPLARWGQSVRSLFTR